MIRDYPFFIGPLVCLIFIDMIKRQIVVAILFIALGVALCSMIEAARVALF